MLLEAGFDPKTHWQWSSALHFAAAEREPQMVALLLKYKADPYALDLYGRSAFDWASADPQTLSAMLVQRPYHPTDLKKREARLQQTVAAFGRFLLQKSKNIRENTHGCASCVVAKALIYLGKGDAARILYAHDGGTGIEGEEHAKPVCTACQQRVEGESRFICLACARAELCRNCRDCSSQGQGPGKACQGHKFCEIPQEPLELPGEREIGRDQAWRAWIERLVSVHAETSEHSLPSSNSLDDLGRS
ncbi:hypothetical protein BDW66DRAFT_145539 [Aspergillus desertorum]